MTGPSEQSDAALGAKLFRGRGDPMRFAIVELLAAAERRVAGLVSELRSSLLNGWGHLACLKECGLVLDRPQRRAVVYRLAHPELFELLRSAEGLLEVTGVEIAPCPNYLHTDTEASAPRSSANRRSTRPR